MPAVGASVLVLPISDRSPEEAVLKKVVQPGRAAEQTQNPGEGQVTHHQKPQVNGDTAEIPA